jgi:hypothetical protein
MSAGTYKMKRPHILALLGLVFLLAAPRPHGFADKDPLSERPRNFASLDTISGESCEFEYCNSFEKTGCTGELGWPLANQVTTAGTPNCEYTTVGVTDGSEALFVDAASTSITIDEAYDATSEASLYVQFSYYSSGGADATWRAAFWPVDASEAAKYPQVQVKSSTSEIRLACAVATFSSAASIPKDTQYYIQVEAHPLSATTQYLRLYDANMVPLALESCDTAGAQSPALRGVGLGHGLSDHGDTSYDELYVSFAPFTGMFEYWNSFEATGCANEDGIPAATPSATGSPDCDETSKGVSHGSESLDIPGLAVGNYLDLASAFSFDAGTETLWYRFDFTITGGSTHTDNRTVGQMNGAGYPKIMFKVFTPGTDVFSVSCELNSDATVAGMIARSTTYRTFVRVLGMTTGVWIYDGSTLVWSGACFDLTPEDGTGLRFGHLAGPTTIDVQFDSVLVSKSGMSLP